ncbi:hypothetical protein [Methylobacterium sp. J-076]|uniref:hypothetical protein n=1 Tax=Methylobacterium sp. J-076 TaxID=2836655 RepID=UPI001FB95083|nr:hypothetical protein [Methylobacterium sp. J-076]MCJ2014566.1 hypothetical protein [Methylobacterium sp. J-076]
MQTDLFLRAPRRDRSALETFTSLACGLIPTVDQETVRIVAEKLAVHPETPPAVLEALAARSASLQATILAGGAPAAEGPGAETAADEAPLPAMLTARLASLPALRREAIEDLSSDGRAEVDLALALNHGITLAGAPLRRLVERARRFGDLARVVLARPDVTAADLTPLYLHADPARRESIVRAVEATAGLRPCPPVPRGLGAALTALSTDRDVPAFVATLAESLGLPADFITAVDEADARYDLLTLAIRAAGLHEDEAVYVFLTLNQGVARSAQRVASLVAVFRSLGRAAARDLLMAVLDMPLAERAPGLHRPHHGPEASFRHSAESAAPQRVPLPTRTRQDANR